MMDVGRAGRTDGSNSSARAARNIAAGKSVAGERPGKEPSIYQWQAAGSLGSRAAPDYGITTCGRTDHASLIALIKR
jgi:hypothetical protein